MCSGELLFDVCVIYPGRLQTHLADQRFVREGCRVVLADKSTPNLDRVIKDLDLKSDQYLRSTIDVRDDQALQELVTSIPKKLGRLDFAM